MKDKFSFYVSFFQIYNEKVYDLLNLEMTLQSNVSGRKMQENMSELKVRWNEKDQFVVENLFLYHCKTPQEAIHLYTQGVRNKIVSAHQLNHVSSRSHCIFSI
mmetsp:Transcript_46458/g.34125  ORF Transcript_46458/g.34125 Transcript_46458/m.34125 type:complete len:103 (+) Transcript_46458:173-481(+)|eukprot:CAMPEP_0202975704 /NCGR_PEP_ID=MMETSP1396-20130829/71311_1 /ASSEMBLY_ACC=CAM_ASM_000872 /TAXON_ID= /ORGANISM="Pseudokeronopsis sp., Strain Brazil" /LENGTH=102 /DNA_ID=CAMNT_0049711753 /DNA_START=140 /DNA_END=445 /DNA_ORIENTATION=-